MSINGKRMAFLGLLLACAVLLVVLSSILEFNTLFLLAGASFLVGVAIRECGLRLGVGYFIGGTLLSFMLAPNKLYCFTFTAMSLYIVVAEFSWDKLAVLKGNGNKNIIFWMIKYIAFNLMFIPTVLLLPKAIYQGTISSGVVITVLIGGQVALLIYDLVYQYFQRAIWGKLRFRIHL